MHEGWKVYEVPYGFREESPSLIPMFGYVPTNIFLSFWLLNKRPCMTRIKFNCAQLCFKQTDVRQMLHFYLVRSVYFIETGFVLPSGFESQHIKSNGLGNVLMILINQDK